MSFEKFKEIDASEIPIGKLIIMIAKGHTTYLNHRLEELNISSSQLQNLFEIRNEKETNQDNIAKGCSMDKGSVARSLRKLEEKGLILKEIDENNRRQNKISLTEKGNEVIEKSLVILEEWEKEVFNDISDDRKRNLQETLKETVIKSISVNRELKNKDE